MIYYCFYIVMSKGFKLGSIIDLFNGTIPRTADHGENKIQGGK